MGSIDFSANTATLRYGHGQGRDGLKKEERRRAKPANGNRPDLQCIGEFVVHNDKGRIPMYAGGPDGISHKTTQKRAMI
jgi:hypothetical protein